MTHASSRRTEIQRRLKLLTGVPLRGQEAQFQVTRQPGAGKQLRIPEANSEHQRILEAHLLQHFRTASRIVDSNYGGGFPIISVAPGPAAVTLKLRPEVLPAFVAAWAPHIDEWDMRGIAGLRAHKQSNGIVLTWPKPQDSNTRQAEVLLFGITTNQWDQALEEVDRHGLRSPEAGKWLVHEPTLVGTERRRHSSHYQTPFSPDLGSSLLRRLHLFHDVCWLDVYHSCETLKFEWCHGVHVSQVIELLADPIFGITNERAKVYRPNKTDEEAMLHNWPFQLADRRFRAQDSSLRLRRVQFD